MNEENKNKFITIIRPQFMDFCNDACKAAAFNHLLYRIAGKCKNAAKEDIQAGKVAWYGSNEQITSEMSNAWGVCKVRKEINGLVQMGLIGRTKNLAWGQDRTKHFFFGTEQCQRFIQLCEDNEICIVHLDLPPEVKHLIYSSNANDKSIKCTCEHLIDLSDEVIDISNANDRYIEAVPKIDTKIDNKEKETNIPASMTSASVLSAIADEPIPLSSSLSQGKPVEDVKPQPLLIAPMPEPAPTVKKKKELPPLVMPPDDAKWNAETMVTIVEVMKGRRYTEKVRSQELRAAHDLIALSSDVTRERFLSSWSVMVSWSVWQSSSTEPMLKHLLKDDRIITLGTQKKPDLRIVGTSSQQATQPAAPRYQNITQANREKKERYMKKVEAN